VRVTVRVLAVFVVLVLGERVGVVLAALVPMALVGVVLVLGDRVGVVLAALAPMALVGVVLVRPGVWAQRGRT
jgi:hypothetical protein